MLPDKIFLEIVTPTKLLYSGNVSEISLPGLDGYLGILPGHAPLISELGVGEISFQPKTGGAKQHMTCAGGYAEVLPDQVSVLAEVAERPEEIDVPRAQSAKERAEQRLRSKDPDTDYKRAQVALERALIRIQVAKKANPDR